MTCGAILLAAGAGSRMASGHKLLMTWRDKPLVVHAAEALLAAGLPTLVVTGHRAAEVKAALAGLSLHFVETPDHALGLAHSLRAGLAAAPPDWDAALVMLADMPRLEPDLLRRLARTQSVALPVFEGRRGNPVRWPRDHWPALMMLSGDEGARRLLSGLPVTEVEAASDAIHADIDTDDALDALRRL